MPSVVELRYEDPEETGKLSFAPDPEIRPGLVAESFRHEVGPWPSSYAHSSPNASKRARGSAHRRRGPLPIPRTADHCPDQRVRERESRCAHEDRGQRRLEHDQEVPVAKCRRLHE